MKTIITAVAITLAFAVSAMAADTITFPTKMGAVTFQHKAHQERLKNCKICHEKEVGKIEGGFSKDWAHKTCKGCHTEKKAGPTKCGECHKK